MSNKKKVVYVLGSAFSGSTIFGFILGNFPQFVNLGEVINIGHDFNPKSMCSCGNKLEDCSFYMSSRKRFIDSGFDYQRNRMLFDVRGLNLKKFGSILKLPLNWLYSKEEINGYLDWNSHLFLSHSQDDQIVIDLSKTSERLNLLGSDERLEIKVVHLTRPISEVYYSNLKRPKKTRNILPFKKWREAIYVNLRFYSERRIAMKFGAYTFAFENISNLTSAQWPELLDFLAVNDQANHRILSELQQNKSVDISKQHVFVGNRWIKSFSGKTVPVERKYNSNSSKTSDLIIRIVTSLFRQSEFLN